MLRAAITVLAVAGIAMLSGCGETCESVQEDLQELGTEIRKNPETAFDRAEELEALRDKLQAMDCIG